MDISPPDGHRSLTAARSTNLFGSPSCVNTLGSSAPGVLWWMHQRAGTVFIIAARLSCQLIVGLTKDTVASARPILVRPVAQVWGYSYPSGRPLAIDAFCGSRPC
jgi:membrane-associated phospholipid phosphatase